jgi:hypothetical protein
MIQDKLIVVASHKDMSLKPLDYPYREVYRVEENTEHNFQNVVTTLDGIKNPTLTWSEYPAFYSVFPLPDNIRFFGLNHYRCTLDLTNNNDNTFYYDKRYDFYMSQVQELDNYMDKIVIAKKQYFKTSLWNQLNWYIKNSKNMDVLSPTCSFFDQIIKEEFVVNSKNLLQTSREWYSRNLFMGEVNFANRWYYISYELIKFLDQFDGKIFVDPRWGAYIVERFFSLYVMLLKNQMPQKVIDRQIIWFHNNP